MKRGVSVICGYASLVVARKLGYSVFVEKRVFCDSVKCFFMDSGKVLLDRGFVRLGGCRNDRVYLSLSDHLDQSIQTVVLPLQPLLERMVDWNIDGRIIVRIVLLAYLGNAERNFELQLF